MKRHRFDPFSFLFGAVFLTVGLTVATGGSGVDAVRPFRAWPAAVILTGLVLVLWTVSRVVRSGAGEVAEPVAEGVPDVAGVEDAKWAERVPGAAEGAEEAERTDDRNPNLTDTADLDEMPPP
jgi:hypothetical protein